VLKALIQSRIELQSYVRVCALIIIYLLSHNVLRCFARDYQAAGHVEPNLLWSLSNDIANLVNCEVDLLDLRTASTVMQYQVISTGKTVWDIGLQAHLFKVFILSEKLALNEAREPLLRAITKEGHVYAR